MSSWKWMAVALLSGWLGTSGSQAQDGTSSQGSGNIAVASSAIAGKAGCINAARTPGERQVLFSRSDDPTNKATPAKPDSAVKSQVIDTAPFQATSKERNALTFPGLRSRRSSRAPAGIDRGEEREIEIDPQRWRKAAQAGRPPAFVNIEVGADSDRLNRREVRAAPDRQRCRPHRVRSMKRWSTCRTSLLRRDELKLEVFYSGLVCAECGAPGADPALPNHHRGDDRTGTGSPPTSSVCAVLATWSGIRSARSPCCWAMGRSYSQRSGGRNCGSNRRG